jgi:Leucine-rich repeat (LRR) protein
MSKQTNSSNELQELPSEEAYAAATELVRGVRNSGSSEINLSDLRTLDKIPPLDGLSRVREINLRHTKIVDLSPLSQLPTLGSLNIGHTKVTDFSILSNFGAIETLDLSDTSFADLRPLSRMSALRSLILARTKVVDLSPLCALAALRNLNLDGTNISDLSSLSDLTTLYQLSLRHTKVADLRPLVGLHQLTELRLWGCPIADFSPLGVLTSLQRLELWRTKIADLSILGELKELRKLDLDETEVNDLTPLAKLQALEMLYLSDTKISNLAPLAELPELEIINIHNTQVQDLSPLSQLTKLRRIRMNGSRVADLAPLAGIRTLTGIELDDTQVRDLSPLADLRGIAVSAGANLDGLSFANCPLDDSFLRWLSARENPERTVDAIAHLRRSKGLPPLDSEPEPLIESPPDVPTQGSGPHFVVRDDGVLTFAPPEALDRQGNNVSQLRLLHPPLMELAQHLAAELSRGNVPYAYLNDRIQSYSLLVNQELSKVPFDRLYVEGVRLQNAANSTSKAIEEGELPPFSLPIREGLDSLLQLHGTFVLSTAVGLELIGAEQRYKRDPQEESALRKVAREFAEQLQDRPDIVTPEAARFVLKAVEDTPGDKNPERSAIVATSTAKNAAIVIISGATIGALSAVGAAIGGPAGLVGGGLIALIGAEGLKKSKSFLMIAGILTGSLDQLRDADLQAAIEMRARTLAPYVGFVLNAESILRRLGNLSQFQWLHGSLDWLKEHARQSAEDKAGKK